MSRPDERAVSVRRNLVVSFVAVEVEVVKATIQLGSPHDGVNLRGEAGVLEQIATEIVNGCLYLRPADNANFSTELPVEVELSVPSLDSVACAAGGQLVLEGCQGGALRISSASGARVWVTGRLDQVWAGAQSGSFIDLSALSCRNVSAQSSSGGRIV